MTRTRVLGIGAALGLGLTTLIAGPSAVAHERYNDGCVNCHGDFQGPVSPQGTIFPEDDKHDMHRGSAYMDTDCNLCHVSGDFEDPFIGLSAGTANNPGVGCTGCHGRDYGGGIGNSGVGLRAHHAAAGISCAGCHSDDPTPLPENVAPIYYGTVDTNAGDPCNSGPDFLENWSIGDTRGIDNDGDLLYDGDDPDCSPPVCTGDLDGSNEVAFGDLLIVLSNWGSCPGCPADLDGDGTVAFSDLLIVLSNWGPC